MCRLRLFCSVLPLPLGRAKRGYRVSATKRGNEAGIHPHLPRNTRQLGRPPRNNDRAALPKPNDRDTCILRIQQPDTTMLERVTGFTSPPPCQAPTIPPPPGLDILPGDSIHSGRSASEAASSAIHTRCSASTAAAVDSPPPLLPGGGPSILHVLAMSPPPPPPLDHRDDKTPLLPPPRACCAAWIARIRLVSALLSLSFSPPPLVCTALPP